MVKNHFLKNVGILTGGTAFAQGIAILALPLLTRLYTPQHFELLAVYMALLALGTDLVNLRYAMAVPLPKAESEASNLFAVSVLSALSLSTLFLLVTIIWAEPVAGLLRQPELLPYLWMVPVGWFVASLYNSLQYWASRQKRFWLVTRTRVTRALGGLGVQVIFGVQAASAFGLIFGQLVYSGLGVFSLARNARRTDSQVFSEVSMARMRTAAKSYVRFPQYSVPEFVFNTGGDQLPIIIIAAYAAGPEAGFLMLAMRVLGVPMALVGSSVAQVFHVEAPHKFRSGELPTFTLQTMWGLARSGFLPMCLIGALAPVLAMPVFGPDWERAGMIVAMLAPYFWIQFIASPVSVVLHVVGRLHWSMWLQAFGLLLRVGAVIMATRVEWLDPIVAFAVGSACFYLCYASVAFVASKVAPAAMPEQQ